MANKTLVFFFFLFFCCCISFLFFMYSSSSHEEPDWLFFFLSESPSKIQAQPVDGPSMWVSTCSFVVLHRIFSSFCLWSLLDSFLPSCCSVVSYVLERVRERQTETESECLCVCVCVNRPSRPGRSSFFLFFFLVFFAFQKFRACGNSFLHVFAGPRRCIGSQHEHGPPPANERRSKRSKHEERARGHDFVSGYSSSSSNSSFLR
jgi:hypothetical protein